MRASYAPRKEPPSCPKSPPFPWRFVGILLLALVLPIHMISGFCVSPPVMDHMTISSVNKTRYGSGEVVRYRCHPGYSFKEWPFYFTVVCLPNGTWQNSKNTCIKSSCLRPEIKNGDVFPRGVSFSLGTEIHIYCKKGYYLKGIEALTCIAVGDNIQWNYKYPICESYKPHSATQPPVPNYPGSYPPASANPAGTNYPGNKPPASANPAGPNYSGTKPPASANPAGPTYPGNKPPASANPAGPNYSGTKPPASANPAGPTYPGSKTASSANPAGNKPPASANPAGPNYSGTKPPASANPAGPTYPGNKPPASANPAGPNYSGTKPPASANPAGPTYPGSKTASSANPAGPNYPEVTCKPPVLEHGKVISESRELFSYRDAVILECLQGFSLNGSHAVFCGGNSTWEPEMPKCIKGYDSTDTIKEPVSNHPEYSTPKELSLLGDFGKLDSRSISLLILIAIVAILLVYICLYRYLFTKKQKKKEEEEKEEKEKKEKEEKEKKEKEEKEKKEEEKKEKEEKEKKEKEEKEKKEKEKKEKENKGKREVTARPTAHQIKPTSPSVRKH
ncbi:membrane cofactor protein-like isoform X3 [Vicugna pacos]|uniref:Membrane cofactor protein-like isoform X2 n=1 Tax=Vicugna pacos TaxID=30538 RepID=A0ABM5C7D5_VICPA